jgi:hypothetical protein
VADAQAERYEEQMLSATRGNLRIRLRFGDQSLLEISEAIVLVDEEPHWLSYRYHYQSSRTGKVFRYDNAPHHVEVATHPDHKHSGDDVLASRILLSSKFCRKLKSFEVRRQVGTRQRILTGPWSPRRAFPLTG